MYDRVKASIARFGSFTETQLSALLDRLTHITIAKGQLLFREKQVCQQFYFVNKGAFREYTILDSGEEATLNLWIENDWMFEYKSFMTQQPSASNIEAASDGDVFLLSGWDFHELVKISDKFFQLASIMQQAVVNSEYQHNRLSPEEKYELLLKNKPGIIQAFPLKHIASYLGMTPETLSRVRKKISS